jgi:hypothetical protein
MEKSIQILEEQVNKLTENNYQILADLSERNRMYDQIIE